MWHIFTPDIVIRSFFWHEQFKMSPQTTQFLIFCPERPPGLPIEDREISRTFLPRLRDSLQFPLVECIIVLLKILLGGILFAPLPTNIFSQSPCEGIHFRTSFPRLNYDIIWLFSVKLEPICLSPTEMSFFEKPLIDWLHLIRTYRRKFYFGWTNDMHHPTIANAYFIDSESHLEEINWGVH